jgi:hypothetical protein
MLSTYAMLVITVHHVLAILIVNQGFSATTSALIVSAPSAARNAIPYPNVLEMGFMLRALPQLELAKAMIAQTLSALESTVIMPFV